jgi:transcriptional regulator with XRE-family HTH domain
MEYKILLLKHFLDWQKREGELKSQREFADYVGIHKMVMSKLFSGQRGPSQEVAEKLYLATGDPLFCELAGYDVPDTLLKLVRERWPHLSETTKNNIAELIGIYDKPQKAPTRKKLPPAGG